MTGLLVALAVKAAVTQVTVFSDRARVQRAADVQVDGRVKAELPLLPDSVDPSSIRVEASGAEVQKVDLQHVEPDEFPADEARDILARLERLDDQLGLLAAESSDLQATLNSLRRVTPQVKDENAKPRARLNASGWSAGLGFADSYELELRGKIREREERARDLQRERQALAERGQLIGGAQRRSGWRVTATLEGNALAHLTLTYQAMQARWVPAYDLQLQSDQKSVRVAFSGAASQETGEDWSEASFILSTAVPASARTLPEIATWKIGEKERFIPTPYRADRPRPPPPPPSPPPPEPMQNKNDELRAQLLNRLAKPAGIASGDAEGQQVVGVGNMLSGGARPAEEKPALAPQSRKRAAAKSEPRPMAAAPPPAPAAQAQMEAVPYGRNARSFDQVKTGGPEQNYIVDGVQVNDPAVGTQGTSLHQDFVRAEAAQQVGIAPPPSWQPPYLPPESPASLAGGYELEFASLRKDTLKSGGGARRVLLFSESWPVTTERLLFPALAPDAFLVAQIKNPSQRTLPRGQASLAVGADPAGTAGLPLVAPGEEFTLPLGIDRAIHPQRNVTQVQTEKGLFSKDEVTRYAVVIEVANPYPAAIPLRIVDQLPLQADKNIEVENVDVQGAEKDASNGKLTWRVTAPASGKIKVGFTYELKRPKGYRVHQ